MKIAVIFLLIFTTQVKAELYGQRVTLNFQNQPIKAVFSEIQNQTGFDFLYNSNLLDKNRKVTVQAKNSSLDVVLTDLFRSLALDFEIDRTTVLVVKKQNTEELKKMQSYLFKGKVMSDKGTPIGGASIKIKQATDATTTNSQGYFSLKHNKPSAVLVITAIGFESQEVAIDSDKEHSITLKSTVSDLEEVVVVGFGTQKKISVVGAVQSVKPDDLKTTSSNLSTAFAGNIPGIIASQPSGEPGYDQANFYIRGISTFGSNRTALIVLDGVEINSTMLNNIPPESIESFSILKDATATALYGSRGANGVIIINTKSGRNTEKMLINVRLDNTVSMPTFVQKIADGVTYMENYNEAVKNSTPANQTYVPFYSQEKIDGTRNKLNPYIFPDNNWYDMLFKDFSMNQNFNFNLTGGTKKVDYFLNTSIFNENGIIKEPKEGNYDTGINNRKFLFQSNVSSDVTKSTRIGLKMNTQLWYNDRPQEDVTDLFYYTMRANPVRFPATLPAEEGDTFVRYGNNTSWDVGPIDLNPYALLSKGYGNRYYSYLTTVLNVDQDLGSLVKGLSAKFLTSFYNYTYSGTYRTFTPFYFKVNDNYTVNPDGTYNFTTESIGTPGSTYLTSSVGRAGHREYSVQGSVNYDRTFGRHEVNGMVVMHAKEQVKNTPEAEENDILPFRQQGLAGRLTYNYDTRYFTEVNFGYNGSENFISGKRYGFFPSAAVGYLISNEPYFKGLKNIINLLKIRASYGLSGNDALSSRFPYLTTVTMSNALNFYKGINFSSTSGPKVSIVGNEDATWEQAKKANIGLDVEIAKAFSLTIDYFNENRSGIFMQRLSLPTSVGLAGTTPYANIGKVKNNGVDFTVSYKRSYANQFSFSATGNFTYAHNEVVAKDEPRLLYPYTSVIGRPINTIYGLVSDKLFANQQDIDNSSTQEFSTYKPGDIKYKDLNGDNRINGNDITALGYPTIPEIIYGFNGALSYKKFDLSFLIQGANRVSLRMNNMHPFVDAGRFGFNITQYIADDHWSEENQNIDAAYPRLSSTWNVNNIQSSDFWVKDASYIRLKYAEMGFRFNKTIRMYVSGANLLSLHSFKYWDPEMGDGNGLKYPLQRTAKMGIQCQF
ncbi:TonB-dependent receptor [Sphingobacterium psychroaquaticum]|uniref:TonB-linked outer membrane protein, SusC/RagA family n=1 Tax=Sphingobacterium psychroaquaticum TaxID=561061 RepID=A0A1X7ICK0_9SPHI|nr:TonB-dependent receptor [Sphingobacterium psychroaquaticum]SMG12380.1 TonB-linked outer membrane protein, SusC/RagA family [Sphingobacterium psychroaquaticum]